MSLEDKIKGAISTVKTEFHEKENVSIPTTSSCMGCGKASTLVCARCNLVHFCGASCQKISWPLHKFTCSPDVEVRESDVGDDMDAGFGLFSRQVFKMGDVIFTEKPVLTVPDYNNAGMFEQISQAEFSCKPKYVKQVIMDLEDSHCVGGAPKTLAGIIRTNCIPQGENRDKPQFASLYPVICRANHACDYNAIWMWREDLGREILVCMRPIMIGDEITVVYYPDPSHPRAVRQNAMKKLFGFECKCNLCRYASDESDKVRQEIKELVDLIAPTSESLIGGSTNIDEAISLVHRIIELKNSIGHDTPKELKNHHFELANFYQRNNRDLSEWHLHEARRLEDICLGVGVRSQTEAPPVSI